MTETPILPPACEKALKLAAIAEAIAYADGWTSFDECFAQSPDQADTYLLFAQAALAALFSLNAADQKTH
ncbi:MAG: hypothetical protein AB7E52_01085 [Bdellovibrionales bacterium]